ncbi:MFS transporter [Streptomyces sp. NPDC056975]|uniref:MFS transporter n=1 Tax=Streptomyces sp. NPDC056975 TaxID=3345985 RepID=UPI003629EF8E
MHTTLDPAAAPRTGGTPSGRRRPGLRWGMISLAFAGCAVNNIDRSAISVSLPYMSQDLHISATVEGLILGWFFLMYAFCLLPAGSVVDRFGARLVYGAGGVVWGIATVLTAAVQGVTSLLGLRMLLGVGEATQYPSCVQATARWFPARERATATAVWDMGARVGGVLTMPLMTAVIGWWGWRAGFVAAGALGCLWAVGWLVMYREPRAHRRLSQVELRYIEDGQDKPTGPVAEDALRWRDLFRYRAVWGMMLGFFCFNYIAYFFITWFPSYLVHARGFDLLHLGFFGMIPGIVAVGAEFVSGVLQDRAAAAGVATTRIRKTPLVLGMLLASVIVVAVLVPSQAAALALFSLSYGLLMIGGPSIGSLPLDFAPTPRHIGSLGGIQNFAGNLAGFAGPIITGALIDASGSYLLPVAVTGVVSVAGAATYLFLVPRLEPIRVGNPAAGPLKKATSA